MIKYTPSNQLTLAGFSTPFEKTAYVLIIGGLSYQKQFHGMI